MYVIAVGNPFDGVVLYGPYADYEAAEKASERLEDCEWWILKLKDPKEIA